MALLMRSVIPISAIQTSLSISTFQKTIRLILSKDMTCSTFFRRKILKTILANQKLTVDDKWTDLMVYTSMLEITVATIKYARSKIPI